MNFKFWTVGLLFSLVCGAAQASTVTCQGKYLSFKVTASVPLNGDLQPSGPVHISVKGTDLDKSAEMDVVDSDIQVGRLIRISARNETGTGSVDAAEYNAAKNYYSGTLSADGGNLGTANLHVNCVIR